MTAPKDAVLDEFGRRLQAKMDELGLNQAELARLATKFMPEGMEMKRDTISLYVNRKNLPRPDRLEALCKALKVERKDLLPQAAITGKRADATPISVSDSGEGYAWLRVNQRVPWPIAVKVMDLLRGDADQ